MLFEGVCLYLLIVFVSWVDNGVGFSFLAFLTVNETTELNSKLSFLYIYIFVYQLINVHLPSFLSYFFYFFYFFTFLFFPQSLPF